VQESRSLQVFICIVLVGIIIIGIAESGINTALQGFLQLQITPARLVTDFVAVVGVGPTLLNVASVGLLGVIFLAVNTLKLSGATLAALFTMMGFAFFGKTVFNCVPIMIGVSLSSLLVKKKPRDYALIAMFGTAMGPLVTFIAFELGVQSAIALPVSIGIGIGIGLIFPPIAIATLRLHQGYNLYNIGLAAGFLGLFTASLSDAAGANIVPLSMWGTANEPILIALIPFIACAALVSIGCKNPEA